MKGKSALLASAIAVTAVAAIGIKPVLADESPSNEALLKRIEALEAEVQRSQVQSAEQHREMSSAASKLEGWWNDTKISGRMYFNLSNIDHESNGVSQSDNGFGFDIKRFYVGIDHKFDDTFSANITTDFTYDSGAGATQIYIKKAYLEAKLDPMFNIRAGSTDLPWIPFVESLYGYRFIENVLVDHAKFGTSADWGVHVKGEFADGMIEYALAVVDGAGYKKPFRSKSMDFEGRVSANFENFTVGVGGYVGKLGKDVEGATTYHTASRLDVIAAYKGNGLRAGIEYFKANDWGNVATVASDESEGYGAFLSYQFTKEWAAFGRYDYVESSRTLNPMLNNNYFNVGIVYSPAKIVDLALVYKREKAENGTVKTSNGTIGGSIDGSYDEVGLFGRLRW